MSVLCTFCAEPAGLPVNENLLRSILQPRLKVNSRILFETTNWLVMPTIGPLRPGHLLMVSRRHYTSVGACPDLTNRELEGILEMVAQVLFDVYGLPVAAFEHGAVSYTKKGGCCVDHAHVHVLPCPFELLNPLKESFSVETITHFSALSLSVEMGQPYLFYQDPAGMRYLLTAPVIASQCMRILIARKQGTPQIWNWRMEPGLDIMAKTFLDLDAVDWASRYRDISSTMVIQPSSSDASD